MTQLVTSTFQRKFGRDKWDKLPRYCRECPVLFACHGGCPKDRFIKTPDGEDGLNYLCAGYKRFFTHIDPYMRQMAALIRSGQPAWLIMDILCQKEQPKGKVGPNDPCPCGSGRKFKKCCMVRG